jgi:hypothetical protein
VEVLDTRVLFQLTKENLDHRTKRVETHHLYGSVRWRQRRQVRELFAIYVFEDDTSECFAGLGKLDPFITHVPRSVFVGNFDVLDVLQDINACVRLEKANEILTTLFERSESLVIEVAAVENLNWRVEVCKDLDVALELIELSWFPHYTWCDRHAKRVLGAPVNACGNIEVQPFLTGLNRTYDLCLGFSLGIATDLVRFTASVATTARSSHSSRLR